MRAAVPALRAAFLACAAGALCAQQPAEGEPKRLFVDGVVATVNDSTILQSKLFGAAAGTIRTAEGQNRSLSLAEIEAVMRRELLLLISRYRMAQSAKSFGKLTPEQIEQVLDGELERDKEDQVRDFGSTVEFSRWLERRGVTWPTYAQEQRIDKLHDFAMQFAVYDRLRKQSNLYLTPRMLRETYQQNRDFFVHDAMAEVVMVAFAGADAAANAKAAAELWRTAELSPRDVASRFANAVPLRPLLASSLAPPLAQFALAGPVGSVSEPMPRDGGRVFDVLKVTRFVAARNARFEDPKVQEEVRMMAQRQVLQEFEAQALERASERTEVWIYQNGRRISPP